MITKSDCILLLKDLSEKGVDTKEALSKAIISRDVDISCLKFINDNRQLDLTEFYKKIRKNYNQKKSKLYGNIVKEVESVDEVLTTLSSLLLQILLFSKNAQNRQMFLKHARADEISRVLSIYFQTYDLTNCNRLLNLIKADLKAIESLYR